jgi:hypothetical protein
MIRSLVLGTAIFFARVAFAATDLSSQSLVTLGGQGHGATEFDSGVQTGDPVSSTIAGHVESGPSWSFDGSATASIELLPGSATLAAQLAVAGTGSIDTFTSIGSEARSFIRFADTLTPTGLATDAILRIPFHLTGTVTIAPGLLPIPSPAYVTFGQNLCNPGQCRLHFPDQFDGDTIVWNASTAVDELGYIDIPLAASGSTAYFFEFWTRAGVNYSSSDVSGQLTASATGDFSHGGVLGPATFLDAATHDVLNGVGLSSESGYDYLAGTAPEPEPSLLAMGAGASLLALRRGWSRARRGHAGSSAAG